jgi:hypothetical protein
MLRFMSPDEDMTSILAACHVGAIVAIRGEVREVPAAWRKCDGSSVDATRYVELSRVLGVDRNAVAGDGKQDPILPSKVNLPDLRGMRYPHFTQHEGTTSVTMSQLFFGTYERNNRDVEITWLIRIEG